jgi:thymidylate synthase
MPKIQSLESLKEMSIDDFVLEGYKSHPALKAKMAI